MDIVPEYETDLTHGIVYDFGTDAWYSCWRGGSVMLRPTHGWVRGSQLDDAALNFHKAAGHAYMMQKRILPERFRGGMERYLDHGIAPGHFLSAVLKNDLVGAFGAADHISRDQIIIIVQYLLSEVPSKCWGSKNAVSNWIEWKTIGEETEKRAKVIYGGWAGHMDFVPWVEGGNSDRQTDARHIARKEIIAAREAKS